MLEQAKKDLLKAGVTAMSRAIVRDRVGFRFCDKVANLTPCCRVKEMNELSLKVQQGGSNGTHQGGEHDLLEAIQEP